MGHWLFIDFNIVYGHYYLFNGWYMKFHISRIGLSSDISFTTIRYIRVFELKSTYMLLSILMELLGISSFTIVVFKVLSNGKTLPLAQCNRSFFNIFVFFPTFGFYYLERSYIWTRLFLVYCLYSLSNNDNKIIVVWKDAFFFFLFFLTEIDVTNDIEVVSWHDREITCCNSKSSYTIGTRFIGWNCTLSFSLLDISYKQINWIHVDLNYAQYKVYFITSI